MSGLIQRANITTLERARELLNDPEQRQNVLVAQAGFRQPDLDIFEALITAAEKKARGES